MDSATLGHEIVSDDYFSNINPRSMRRILNTLNLTGVYTGPFPTSSAGRIMRAFEIQFTWQQLAQWVSLVEQWPYRMSYIIDACEKGSRVHPSVPLFDIYEKYVTL
jgi:hypothetical protein